MKKYIITAFAFITLLTGSVTFTACEDIDDIKELNLDRLLSPTNLTARVRDKVNIELTWDEMDRAQSYVIEVFKEDPDFIEKNKQDLCASLQFTIVEILMDKLRKAVKDTGITEVAVAGGVSANSGVRNAFEDHARRYGWKIHLPKFSFTTDNAAMVAITGYYKYLDKDFCSIDEAPFSRVVL